MDLYSMVTGLIAQHGRRGALMISMDVSHPDIEEFIDCKKDLTRVTKANISVKVDDVFMDAVKNNKEFSLHFERPETNEAVIKKISARKLFRKLCENNWDSGEPGILFWDNINKYNLLSEDPNYSYAGTNPCVTGDTLILTDAGCYPIRELVGKEITIWNGYEWSDVTPMITGYNQPIRYIETSDGSTLNCTDYHKFILADGSRVKAKDLKEGDRLIEYTLPAMSGKSNLNRTESKSLTISKNIPIGIADTVYCVNEPKNHSVVFNGIMTGNCAEEPLPAYGACLLGAINLSAFVKEPFTDNAYFDTDEFSNTVSLLVDELNNILDEGIPLHPLKQQRETAINWRQIGLGIMGLADMLIKLGIKYGSEKAIATCDTIGLCMANSAIRSSTSNAVINGTYPKYNKDAVLKSSFFENNTTQSTKDFVKLYGLRNSQLLTIAPTGSISNVLGISGGMEPIFANSYTRKTETLDDKDTYFKVYTPIVKEYMDKFGITDEKDLPDYFVTAHEIPYKERIKMQAVWQKHIDASISSTVNLPESATVEDVENLYIMAHDYGLKGVTVFRNNCNRKAILTTNEKKEEKEVSKESKQAESGTNKLARGEVIKCPDNCIGLSRKLRTGCGNLHCLAYFDKNTGELMETYLNKGSTGGCNNFMVGLSRMISMSARAGVSIYDIADQLKSTGSCPSYATRKAVNGDTSMGACCPMAVGNALIDMYNEFNSSILHNDTKQTEETENKTPVKMKVSNKRICPQCGVKLIPENGCWNCYSCGYTKCD